MADDSAGGPRTPLDTLIFYIGAVGMLLLFGLVIYGVGMRYIFNRPPLWSADVPNIVFVWLIFLTVGLTVKLGPQIRVAFFIAKMTPGWRRALLVASHCAVLVMLAAFIWYSIPIIELSSGQTILSTGWPGSVFFYALPVGSLVMAYYHIGALRRALAGHEELHDEGGR